MSAAFEESIKKKRIAQKNGALYIVRKDSNALRPWCEANAKGRVTKRRKKRKKRLKVVCQSCCSHKEILCNRKETAVLALGWRGQRGEGGVVVHWHYFLRSTITSMDNTESGRNNNP